MATKSASPSSFGSFDLDKLFKQAVAKVTQIQPTMSETSKSAKPAVSENKETKEKKEGAAEDHEEGLPEADSVTAHIFTERPPSEYNDVLDELVRNWEFWLNMPPTKAWEASLQQELRIATLKAQSLSDTVEQKNQTAVLEARNCDGRSAYVLMFESIDHAESRLKNLDVERKTGSRKHVLSGSSKAKIFAELVDLSQLRKMTIFTKADLMRIWDKFDPTSTLVLYLATYEMDKVTPRTAVVVAHRKYEPDRAASVPSASDTEVYKLPVYTWTAEVFYDGCAVCGMKQTIDLKQLKICGWCKTVHYCSAEHQKLHWTRFHYEYCSRSAPLKMPPKTQPDSAAGEPVKVEPTPTAPPKMFETALGLLDLWGDGDASEKPPQLASTPGPEQKVDKEFKAETKAEAPPKELTLSEKMDIALGMKKLKIQEKQKQQPVAAPV